MNIMESGTMRIMDKDKKKYDYKEEIEKYGKYFH